MTDLAAAGKTDPSRILAMMTAFEQTAALNAAIGVELFTAIAEGAVTVEALSDRCGCAPRGVRILADTLVVHGLLTKSGVLYGLAPDAAAYLDERSPGYIGAAARFLASPEKIDLYFTDPAGWARRGGPSGLANVSPESLVWVDFARGMTNFMRPMAVSLAKRLTDIMRERGVAVRRLLDVAAGHGLFGIAFALANADTHITALDWGPVLEAAGENARAAGVGARYEMLAGDAFKVPLAGPYDLILAPNFLHHFAPLDCVSILERLRAALAPHGSIAILEYCPNKDRVTPPVPALFALSMLTGTPSGDAYTAPELCAMCLDAGFTRTDLESLPPTAQTLIVAR